MEHHFDVIKNVKKMLIKGYHDVRKSTFVKINKECVSLVSVRPRSKTTYELPYQPTCHKIRSVMLRDAT